MKMEKQMLVNRCLLGHAGTMGLRVEFQQTLLSFLLSTPSSHCIYGADSLPGIASVSAFFRQLAGRSEIFFQNLLGFKIISLNESS